MKKKKPKVDESVYTRKEYKFDRAMQESAKKAAWHPRPISMVSNVKEFQQLGSIK